ncbi:prefoldin subunit beta [Candidatus Micrarchaeota archaeon]|nr:prefoldin subunit beta [Candidatus Micrarchaeota archaeon]
MNEEELRKQLQEFQNIQGQLQMLSMQFQQLKFQQAETEKAMQEVEKNDGPFYRMVSNILVEKDKTSLKKELGEEKDAIDLRTSTFKKQEERLKPKFDELRKKIEQAAKQFREAQ